MAYSITIPFQAVKLRFISGGDIWMPLLDKHAIRINANLKDLASNYAASFQQQLLNKGRFQSILHEYSEGPYQRKKLKIEFEASPDRYSYPDFELEFEYLYRELDSGQFWGMVPVLGSEALGETEGTLQKALEEVIRLDISSNNRLRHLQRVVSLIWYDAMDIFDTPVKLSFPTPNEQELSPTPKEESWLNRVAYLLKIEKPSSYGREEELYKLVRTLKSPYVKNVLLIGPRGVGKSALVWELIRQKAKQGIQEDIWETTASMMIKELSDEVGWQDNLSNLCKELQTRKAILFVRNMHELFEVGKYIGNNVSIADYLVPYLGRGEITLIGECTSEEKALIELKNPGFLLHFQLLQLEEPREGLEEIILKKVSDIAKDQKVELRNEAIEELIRLNKRYTPYAGFPGKPIRFLESLLMHKKALQKENRTPLVLNKSEIIHHFCLETGMPPFMVDPAIPVNFDEVRSGIASNVYGQDQAVESLVNVLTSVKTGMSRTGKPIASFLFVGPTGVGKTELVKVLAEFMFGSRDRLTRFDMSEYSTALAVKGLIGAGPDAEGLLTNAVRREPFGVILFDEIEKAHANFFDNLLQVLSEGRLTDSQGQIANFCSTIIILTSNIGSANLQLNRIGWKKDLETGVIDQHFLSAVQSFFRPELFNRIDQVISFQPLSKETMRLVVNREIELLKKREGINGRKMSLDIGPNVLDFLAETGYNPLYGARYLQRTIQTQLAIPLANLLNQRDSLDHVLVNVRVDQDKLVVDGETDPLSMDLLMEELEKFNLANLSSDKRKEVQKLEEGSVYLKLSNELAILELEKEENPQRFWSNAKKTQQYNQYLQIQTWVTVQKQEIEALELDISLACAGFAPYEPGISERVDSWRTRWEYFRRGLFLQLYPGNECWLCVYGKTLEPVLGYYKKIFEANNLAIFGGGVWYHPHPVPPHIKHIDPEDLMPTASGKEHFTYLPWDRKGDWPSILFDEEKELYGVHWRILGPGASWILKDESGFQKWQEGNDHPKVYSVQVLTQRPELPNNIHRKEYYSNQPIRRSISPNRLNDTIYKIKDAPLGDHQPIDQVLNDFLQKKFQQRIEEALH